MAQALCTFWARQNDPVQGTVVTFRCRPARLSEVSLWGGAGMLWDLRWSLGSRTGACPLARCRPPRGAGRMNTLQRKRGQRNCYTELLRCPRDSAGSQGSRLRPGRQSPPGLGRRQWPSPRHCRDSRAVGRERGACPVHPIPHTAGAAPGRGGLGVLPREVCEVCAGGSDTLPGRSRSGRARPGTAWGRDGWGGEGEGKGEREEEGERERTARLHGQRRADSALLPSPDAVTAGNNGDRDAGGLFICGGKEKGPATHPRPLPGRSCPAPAAGALGGGRCCGRPAGCLSAACGDLREMGKPAGSVSLEGSVLPRAPGGSAALAASCGPALSAPVSALPPRFIPLHSATVPRLVTAHSSFLISCITWRTRTRGEKVWISFAGQCVEF